MDPTPEVRPGIAIVVAGGDAVGPEVAETLPVPDRVIAADSGLDHARAIGLRPDVVVGDMDSVDPALLAEAEAGGAEIVRHPAAKDATDLELALHHARDGRHHRIILIGGGGGRISHLLANAALVASPALAGTALEWRVGGAVTRVVRAGEHAAMPGRPGDLVSLVPYGGAADGVTTEGLRWRLSDATLPPGSTRGISNEMSGAVARVSVRRGTLLAIHERTTP